ncbi:MAG: nuclease-related domain-containing protein, partial [Anaerolineae bacterium]
MTVEYFIQGQPQYAHEGRAILKLAQLMQRAFGASTKFYLLAVNVHFWRAQADALILAPHAITLIELKSCGDPVHGRARGSWHVLPGGSRIRGGSHDNPYQQVVATRETLMKYLDRNRRRFLAGDRVRETAGRWGHVSAALVFSPHLHPGSDIVVPPESRAWLGVIGLNEVAEFLFSRFSPQIDLRPQELRL